MKKNIILITLSLFIISSLTGCVDYAKFNRSLGRKSDVSADNTATLQINKEPEIEIQEEEIPETKEQIQATDIVNEITEDYNYSDYIEKEGVLNITSIKIVDLQTNTNAIIVPVKRVEGILEDQEDFTNHQVVVYLSVLDNIDEYNDYKVSYKCVKDFEKDAYIVIDLKLLNDNSNNYESFTDPDLVITDQLIDEPQKDLENQEPQEIETQQEQIAEVNEASQEVGNNLYIVIDGVNVRDKASAKNSKVIGKLEINQTIDVLEISKNGSWAKFIYNGQEAWTSTKYIKKVQ